MILSVFCGMLLLFSVHLLLIKDTFLGTDEVLRALWNLGHIPLFGITTYLMMQKINLKKWTHQLGYTGIIFLIAIGIEWFQSLIGRDASWEDVGLDMLGAWLVMFWCQSANKQIWVGRVITGILLLLQLSVPGYMLAQRYHMQNQLPIIANFETSSEMRRWSRRVQQSDEHVHDGQYSGKISLSANRFSGVSLRRVAMNWTGYTKFTFNIYNPDTEALPLHVRIDDFHQEGRWRSEDRFNRSITAKPGWTKTIIDLKDIEEGPAQRKLDMKNLKQFRIYASGLQEPVIFYIDNIRLE